MTLTADTTTASGLGWPDAAVPAESVPGSPQRQGNSPGWRWPAAAALLLVVALVAGALAVVQHGSASDRGEREADERAALAAARTVATALDSYDYKDLDKSFDVVIAGATEPFKSQYSSTSTQLKDLLVQYQASATSRIVAAGVAGHTGDTVTVVLFVDQTVTNTTSPQPKSARNRLQLVMRKVGGRFLVAEAQLL